MKIFVQKIQLLYNVMVDGEWKEYKMGRVYFPNEWYEGKDPWTHYAALYKCDAVDIRNSYNASKELIINKKGNWDVADYIPKTEQNKPK